MNKNTQLNYFTHPISVSFSKLHLFPTCISFLRSFIVNSKAISLLDFLAHGNKWVMWAEGVVAFL